MFSNSDSGVLMKRFLILFTALILSSAQVFAVECKSATECSLIGQKLIKQKEYKNAIECFNTAISMDEEEYFAYAFRAKAYFYLKDYEKVKTNADKSIEIHPNSVAYGIRGSYNLLKGNYRNAIDDTTSALELNSKYMKCYEVRARAKVGIEDYIGALKDAGQAIKLNDKYAKSYEVRAMAQMGLKDYISAKDDFEKAAELFKENGDKKNYKNSKKLAKVCQERIK